MAGKVNRLRPFIAYNWHGFWHWGNGELGIISVGTQQMLKCNPENGHVLDDEAAMVVGQHEYEPGWKPSVGQQMRLFANPAADNRRGASEAECCGSERAVPQGDSIRWQSSFEIRETQH